MWSVFGSNRDLRRLVLALAGSTVGYWGYTVAVLVYAFEEGGTGLVGVAAFVRLFPAAVASPVAGAIADRYPRERVIVVGDLLRMLTTAVAGAAAIVLAAPAFVVLTLVGVNAVLFSSFRPAMRALMPALSRAPGELAAANVMASTVESVGMLAGPALGGALLAVHRAGRCLRRLRAVARVVGCAGRAAARAGRARASGERADCVAAEPDRRGRARGRSSPPGTPDRAAHCRSDGQLRERSACSPS